MSQIMTWGLPQKVILVAGIGIATTPLVAFDAALLDAGIGDFNLVKVSSIVPPSAKVYNTQDGGEKYISELAKGTLLPVVYKSITSNIRGEKISVALAAGFPKDKRKSGVIFEVGIVGDKQTAESSVRLMIQDALKLRQVEEYSVVMVAREMIVADAVGCVLGAAVLLP